MDATTACTSNSSTDMASSSSTNLCHFSKFPSDYSVVPKPSQALMQTLKPGVCIPSGSRLTRSTTITSSSLSFATDTAASLTLFKFELPRSKSLSLKTKTTIATTTNSGETDWEKDLEWLSNSLLKTYDGNQKSQNEEEGKEVDDDHSDMTDGGQVIDFQVPLRVSASSMYDSAHRTEQHRPNDLYKRGLLLDDPNVLQRSKSNNGCWDWGIDVSDDLVDFDLEDDVESDEDEIDLSTFMVEYQMPLRDGSEPKVLRNNVGYNNRRELLLDQCFDEMHRLMAQLPHSEQGHDDLLSQGDLESCCYGEERDDDYDDDLEDSASNSSDSDCHRVFGMDSSE
jgi:hypothetical protein